MELLDFLNPFKRRKKEYLSLETGLNINVVQGFFEKIEDIVCITDNNYEIVYINKKELKETYSSLLQIIDYKNNKELLEEIDKQIQDEGFFSDNIEIMQGQEKTCMYISMYYVQNIQKYLVYIKDTNKYIEKETRLKEELSKSNDELRNKDLFVANLSHEIKTPINIIVAMIYFLKSTSLDEKQNQYVKKLEEAAGLLTELTNNILNVTKSNKVTNLINTKEVFSLKTVIDKVYMMFKEEIEKKGIQWSIESNFNYDIELYEDKTKIEQIFINLISNAVKYTDKGYVELEISKTKDNIDSYLIRFCVKDTGRGIKREDTVKIFKEFEQVNDPTIKEREGFGLGLPLVKKIIESMGGKIWLESSYGLGTKFFFELELAKSTQKDMLSVKNEAVNNNFSKRETIKINSNKVLLVDDNKTINEITSQILSEINLECDIADNGMEAIKKIEENGTDYYAVILMDIHMPKYNGYDISRIMKTELGVQSPIVALTATNITEKVIEDNKNYIQSYIQKPVKPEDLKNIVQGIIGENCTSGNENKKRETILFIADKIRNWELLESLNNNFNVICTLNTKDINIIVETKKLGAILIDKTDENAKEEAAYNSKENLVLFLDYKVNNQKQEDVTITSTDGYIRRIDNVKTIGLVLTDIIEKKDKEENIENTIQGYNNEISDIYKFLYESLVNLTSVRSKETGAHLKRTQEYMKVMLEEFEKSFNTGEFEQQKTIEDIGVAATLHDIGKVGIPDEILNKPGKLTDEEYEKMKQHTVIGHQILKNTYSDKISNDILEYAKEITLHHHEKYDGTGYPDGLKGDKIDIISRIMAVIDVYDALVNDRVYKKAMPYSEVEDYIISQSGKAFDPKIVNIFINSKEKLKAINEQYKE